MKTLFQTIFASKEAEKIIETIHTAAIPINAKAKLDGGLHGRRNEPKRGEPINPYVLFIITAFLVIWRTAKLKILDLKTGLKGLADQLQLTLRTMRNERDALTRHIDMVETYRSTSGSIIVFIKFLVFALLVSLVSFGDMAYTVNAFEVFGDNPTMTTAIGICMSLVVLFMYPATSRHIRIPGRFGSLLSTIINVLGLLCVVAAINEVRIMAADNPEKFRENSLAFITMSTACALVVDFLVAQIPRKNEIEDGWKATVAYAQLSDNKSKRKKLNIKIAAMEMEFQQVEEDLRNIDAFEEYTQALVLSLSKKTVADFISENVKYRTDGNSGFTAGDNDMINNLNP